MVRKQAQWAEEVGDQGAASETYLAAGDYLKAIAILGEQVTGRHCHHHRHLLPFTQPPPPPHLLHSSTLREQGAVDRLAEVAKTLGSHQTAELRECVKHLERGKAHVAAKAVLHKLGTSTAIHTPHHRLHLHHHCHHLHLTSTLHLHHLHHHPLQATPRASSRSRSRRRCGTTL